MSNAESKFVIKIVIEHDCQLHDKREQSRAANRFYHLPILFKHKLTPIPET